MTKQPDITPRTVALLKTGLFQHRRCAQCSRKHLALLAAPPSAPCGQCVRALMSAQLVPPPRGRQWSKAYLAFVQTNAGVKSVTETPDPVTPAKRAHFAGIVGDELLQAATFLTQQGVIRDDGGAAQRQ